ncbi:MAG: tyrosine--tRNA ligase [Myxococcota bacterium]
MTSTFLPVDEQLAVILRGTVDLEVKHELREKLERSRREGRPLTVKAGFDPTAPDLHLGHTVLLNKMRQFQDLGHRVVFLIGDFTGRIGDPTGKNVTRPPLSEDAIVANAATYKRQVEKVLDPTKTEVRFNSEWLGSFSFDDVIRLCARYSVARMLERDDFKKRLAEERPISMHELLYPLSQGYDSVALKADIELGGTDQRFNLLVGRDLMRQYGLEPQCILTVPILEGTDAKESPDGGIVGAKMSKSLGNYIAVEEEPEQQFGKIMSICDALMWRYYELLSFRNVDEIAALRRGHPKDAKVALARELVTRFHHERAADQAQAHFESHYGEGKRDAIPDDAPTVTLPASEGLTVVKALVEAGLVGSNADGKRLVAQGGVRINGERIREPQEPLGRGVHAVRVGKTRWARIVVEQPTVLPSPSQ